MGRDKAWLPVGERPAVIHVVEAGLRAGVDAVIVVGTAGQSLPELPAGARRCDDPAQRRHQGPLSGLAVGLEALAEAGVDRSCIAPCDGIWFDAEHVRFVLEQLEQAPSQAAVVPVSRAPEGTSVLHPLCGAVRVGPARAAIDRLLVEGRRAARALFGALDAREIPVSALPRPRVVEGCNTPEQWAEAVALRQVARVGEAPAVD